MDPLLFLSVLALLTCLYFSTSFLLRHNNAQPNYEAPLPHGSLGWPWLGESLKFIAAGRKGKPESFILDRIMKSAPHRVFKTRLLGHKVAVLCGAAGNKLVFSAENKLVIHWMPRFILKLFLVTDQISFDEIKKLYSKLLKKRESLLGYVQVMDECARCHMNASGAWEPLERVEAFKACQSYTFWVTCRLLLRIDPQEDHATFTSLFSLVTKLTMGMAATPINVPGTTYYRALKASKELKRKIGDIVKKRKQELEKGGGKAQAQPTMDDFLTRGLLLISAKDDQDESREHVEHLNDSDLVTGIVGLLVASHDPTSTVITFVLKFLAELPRVYENVYQEQMKIANSKAPGELLSWPDIQKMKYSWNVVCEVMRLIPPTQGGFRQVITDDFVFDGFHIPNGWKVYWNAHSTHRDPKYFAEPETFDPTRFEGTGPAPYSYVPFGGGPRMCPGNEYARILILVFMHNIVTRFKWEQLIPNEKMSVLAFPFPVNGLPIRMISHNKS